MTPRKRHDDRAGLLPGRSTTAPSRALADDDETLVRGSARYDRVLAAVNRRRLAAPAAAPALHGASWLRLSSDDSGWRLLVSSALEGRWEPVVGAPDVGDRSLDFMFPSPRGRYVALGVSEGGSERSTIRVVDVERRSVLPDEVHDASFSHVAWLSDESGFFVSLGSSSPSGRWRQRLFSHTLGASTALVPLEFDEPFVFSEVSPDGRFVAAFDGEDRRLRYVQDRSVGSGWSSVDGDTGPLRQGFFAGDTYIALSHLGHARGRVVGIPLLAAADLAQWRELVPESELVLRSLVDAGRFMVVVGLLDGSSVVSVMTMDGRRVDDVPLPAEGSVAMAPSVLQPPLARLVAPAGERLTFLFTNYRTPPTPHVYSIATGRLERLGDSECTPEAGLFEVRETARAGDGTGVPVTLVYRGELRERPRPTLIYVYGGWNVALTPCWTPELSALLDAGVVIAMPSLRGGGEGGDSFWNAGRGRNLQVTNDDLYTLAEWLVREGVSSAELLAVVGASNGGLVVSLAVSQRPELFGAAVAAVPLTDMVHFTRDEITSSFVTEYGDPCREDALGVLRKISPLNNVFDGKTYPSTLILSCENDIRCPPWHGRKYARELADANAGGRPIVFRLWKKSGHMEFEAGRSEHAAEWITFLLDQLGVDVGEGLHSGQHDQRGTTTRLERT